MSPRTVVISQWEFGMLHKSGNMIYGVQERQQDEANRRNRAEGLLPLQEEVRQQRPRVVSLATFMERQLQEEEEHVIPVLDQEPMQPHNALLPEMILPQQNPEIPAQLNV